jgi:hypothetical protein
MAYLLRKISKPKWVQPEWIDKADVPAQAILDLIPKNNALSLWRVDEDRSNLQIVLEALASNFDHLGNLDYALIDEASVLAIPIKVSQADGDTPHSVANNCHRDLEELSIFKLALLANEIRPLKKERMTEREVEKLLLKAVAEGRLDKEQLKQTLKEALALREAKAAANAAKGAQAATQNVALVKDEATPSAGGTPPSGSEEPPH